jgi:hypothetical protein
MFAAERPTTSSTTSSLRSARAAAAAIDKHNHKARLAAARGGRAPGAEPATGDRPRAGKPDLLPRPPTSSRPQLSLSLPSPSGDSPRVMSVHGEDSPSCYVEGMRSLGKKCICEICTCGYVCAGAKPLCPAEVRGVSRCDSGTSLASALPCLASAFQRKS